MSAVGENVEDEFPCRAELRGSYTEAGVGLDFMESNYASFFYPDNPSSGNWGINVPIHYEDDGEKHLWVQAVDKLGNTSGQGRTIQFNCIGGPW